MFSWFLLIIVLLALCIGGGIFISPWLLACVLLVGVVFYYGPHRGRRF